MRTLTGLLFGVQLVAAAKVGAQADACGLLSPAAIHAVTGEEVTNTKPSSTDIGNVRHAQCFYSLRTFSNSVSVTLTTPTDGGHRAARELWQRWFHRDAGDKPESEEEEAAAKATPVAGVGEEAFWVHSFVGNLYVRKGSQFLRISLGGKMTDAERQTKAKSLAADAIKHMR